MQFVPAGARLPTASRPPTPPRASRRAGLGFTLIELMVAVAIATILLTLGVSGMTRLVAENQRVAEVNNLMGSLNFARNEAVFRAATVSVCPTDQSLLAKFNANDESDTLPCKPSAKTAWEGGYAVFLDQTGAASPVYTLLRSELGSSKVRVRIATTVDKFSFFADGSASNGTFTICDKNDQAANDDARSPDVIPPRVIIVSTVGRVRVGETAPGTGDDGIDCSTPTVDDDEEPADSEGS